MYNNVSSGLDTGNFNNVQVQTIIVAIVVVRRSQLLDIISTIVEDNLSRISFEGLRRTYAILSVKLEVDSRVHQGQTTKNLYFK